MPEEFPKSAESSHFSLSKAGALGFTVVALAAGMAGFAPRNGEAEAQSIAPSPGQPSYFVTPEGATFPADAEPPDIDDYASFPKTAKRGSRITVTQPIIGEADQVDMVLVSHSRYLQPILKGKQSGHIGAISGKPEWPLGRLKYSKEKKALMPFNVSKTAPGKVCFRTVLHAVNGATGSPQMHEAVLDNTCLSIKP